jgi:hypothetical protein
MALFGLRSRAVCAAEVRLELELRFSCRLAVLTRVLSQASAEGASASAPVTVWVKRTDMAGARYDFCKNVDPQQTVDDFKARWMAQEKLDVDPSLVTLRLVACADSEPTAEEEEAAVELDPFDTLAAAGFTDSCSLLAYIETGAHAVSNHACCTHAYTLRTQTRRFPPLRWLHARWRCRSWTRQCSRCGSTRLR